MAVFMSFLNRAVFCPVFNSLVLMAFMSIWQIVFSTFTPHHPYPLEGVVKGGYDVMTIIIIIII